VSHASCSAPGTVTPFASWVRLALAAFGVVGSLFCTVAAAGDDFDLGAPPAWVLDAPLATPEQLPVEQLSGGVYYLLHDHQMRVGEAREVENFYRSRIQVLNVDGIDDVSQPTVEFAPEYEHVTLHTVQVYRGGRVIDQLSRERVKVLQREAQLEDQMYTGTLSLNLILDDIRVGDIVEYSYTITGHNPAFSGRFGRYYKLGWSLPVHHARTRLLWPAGRHLAVRTFNEAPPPAIRERGAQREYLWEAHDVPALQVEADIPDWYDPFPNVQVSEYRDWQELVAWALPHYRVPATLSPALQQEVDRIAAAHPKAPERVTAALRFVQDEVRYMGLENGMGSYIPHPPDEVLQRRFGDCKDKTLLLRTLLSHLGIDAAPAFVNTYYGPVLDTQLPSPTLFDHVIVRVELDGRPYWLDPTERQQRGPLETLDQPDYGFALVVAEGSRAPVSMRRPVGDTFDEEIFISLDLSGGVEAPARYTARTVFSAGQADGMRRRLATVSRAQLQTDYLEFYTRTYPTARIDKKMEVEDDTAANRLTIVEHYTIPGIWEEAEEEERFEVLVEPSELYGYLDDPGAMARTMPYAISHPVRLRQHIVVNLPSDWDVENELETIENAVFRYRKSFDYYPDDRRMVFDYRYVTLKDHVLPEELAAYSADLKRLDDLTGDTLYYNPNGAAESASPFGDLNVNLVLYVAFVLALSLFGAVSLYLYDPKAPLATLPDPSLAGLGGWLVLVAIGLCISPLNLVKACSEFTWAFSQANWDNLAQVGSANYHPLWAPGLYLEIGGNLALLVFSLLLAVMFFQKRRTVPTFFVVFRISGTLLIAFDYALMQIIPALAATEGSGNPQTLIRDGLYALIWSSYFLKSERVKATFRRERRPRPAAALEGGGERTPSPPVFPVHEEGNSGIS